MTRVLGIDAGESTGLAVVDFTQGGTYASYVGQFTDGLVDTVSDIINATVSFIPDVVVIEQFDLRPGNKFLANLSTVYRNGALEYALATEVGTDPVWQTPAQAKGLVSDAVLKRLGDRFWPTGKDVGQKDADDARDALRHAIHYAVVTLKHRPTIEKGWPNR